MNQYYIGLAKKGKTLVIEARRDKDSLSCELYDYMGLHETTKAQLYAKRYLILKLLRKRKPTVYGNLRYAIVD
jgi:hypothetical protein